jgi:type VI secretion system secreted protein VgrG
MHDEKNTLDRTRDDETSSAAAFGLVLGGFGPRALSVLRVRGREALSRPYAWAVTFTASDPSFEPSAVLGHAARLTIAPLAETPREVFGVVAAIKACGGIEHGRRSYRARIVPRLALLKRRRTSRVFEGRTVPEIIAAVLDLGGIAHRFETRADYTLRAYCVQYQETDLEFVRRLCAEVGIWFRFDAPERPEARGAAEVVTFGDSDAAPEVDGGARLALRRSYGSALQGDDTHVTAFDLRRAVVPSALTVRGYDFRRPGAPLEARAAQGAGDVDELAAAGDVYEHQDRDEDAKDAESGLVGAFLGQLAHGAHTAEGASSCPRLSPGRRFELDTEDGHDGGAHVVTTIEHEGRAPRLAGERPSYENRFSCLPANLTPRPPRPRRRVQTVTETAIVVGPQGSEIHTDEHGRIRVRFHWQTDEHGACWARVAEPWAGASWGSQWIPRVGMEVLVAFLGGDASRPVVLGCLRNATHPAPFALPRDKATSGIRTRSTPGGDGYNELSFNDTKGAEVVCLRAERNLATMVRNDEIAYVGHDQTISVRHDRAANIFGSDSLMVRERLSIEVAGNARQEMSDDRIAHATGGGAGMALAGGNASLKTKGDISLSAGGNIAIDAAGNLTIKVGGTVTIQASGALSIEGATVTANAGGAVVIKGATVDLNP